MTAKEISMNALPCPFCGGTNIGLQTGSRPYAIVVYCADCGAGGPERFNWAVEVIPFLEIVRSALKAWNTRDVAPGIHENVEH